MRSVAPSGTPAAALLQPTALGTAATSRVILRSHAVPTRRTVARQSFKSKSVVFKTRGVVVAGWALFEIVAKLYPSFRSLRLLTRGLRRQEVSQHDAVQL